MLSEQMQFMAKNSYSKISFFSILTLLSLAYFNSYAQIANKETNVAFLKQNAILLKTQLDYNREKAFAIAKTKGWETFKITKAGSVVALQGIDEIGLPIYYTTYNNSIAAATTNTNKLYTGGGLGLNLSGSTIGNGRVAIWDGGAILTSHVELINRIINKDNATTLSTHATHVAGTMMATGLYPAAKGMAFGLSQLLSFEFNGDISEMSANAATLLVSNHSYGAIAGWRYNDDVTPARWEFWGSAGENEDYRFGHYNNAARDWDLICYNAPYYLPVKSAGNSRNENGPAVGEPYFRYNASGVMSSAGNRPAGISSNNGYDIISTYGTAKNILTVGAVNPLPFGVTSPSSIQVSSFSSWGPTDDGRIKPDLVGDGVSVTSTSDANTTAYATLSGTSMASPNISGSLVLLQELYSQKNAGAFMKSATLKALVIGTASEAGSNPGPDYVYGWGLLNTEEAAKAILNKGNKSNIIESTLAQGTSQTFNVIASGNGPLIATICWTDPEATPIATPLALNNTTLRLVNDLDLRATQNTTTFSPWVLNPAIPSAAATTGDNFRDNVEQVYIANAIPGKSYTFTISHKGTLLRGPQAFSLVLTGVGGATYCTSLPSSNADSKIINFKLANIDNTTATTNCTTYADFTTQNIEVEKGKTYPLSITLGTCGANFDKIAKVFVDWNGDGDFDDTNELTATSGTINATGVFTTNITIPDIVNINNFSLLRIVLVETNIATNVLACGTYTKGETQDYRIKFLNPSVDVALNSIPNTTGTVCANTTQNITVRLKNNGTQTLTNIPVTVTVTENNTLVTTLNATYTGSLSYLNETEFTLTGSFNALPGKTYSITAKTNLIGDLNINNDQLTTVLQISNPPIVTNGIAYFCSSIAAYSLDANADGTIFWYKNAADVNPFAFGNTATTIVAPAANNTFYAGINDFKAEIGPKTKNEIGDGTYNQFTPGLSITTLAPITLESAKLYIGNSGQIKFTAVNASGIAVSSVLLNVSATKSIPVAGASINDLNDQGQVYPLNLFLPAAGTFTINIEYLGGATIFRNNVNNTNYPYNTALGLFNITGNTATLSGNANYFKTFWYYFYDLKVKAGGCLGGARLAVPINTVIITQNKNVLSSNFATNNQWYLDGKLITGATNQHYTALQNGKYTVESVISGSCVLKSEVLDVTNISIPTPGNEIALKAYPVPTNGEVNINFIILDKTNVSILISNLLGQVAFTDEKLNYTGMYTHKINLSSFANGIYVLKVKVGTKVYFRKILLTK